MYTHKWHCYMYASVVKYVNREEGKEKNII